MPTCRPSTPKRAALSTGRPWTRRAWAASRQSSATDTFVVVEKWESVDALKGHAAAPHMAAYGAKVKDMLASRVIHVLSPA
jgi:quinol monooxygenase YgiN